MGEVISMFVYCFAVLGFSYVLGFSKLTLPFREAGAKNPVTKILVLLVECPACLGFWVGIAALIFRIDPLHLSVTIWNAIYFGLFTSGINLFLALRSGLIPGNRE